MSNDSSRQKALFRLLLPLSFALLLIPIPMVPTGRGSSGRQADSGDPWTLAQTVQPAALAAELKGDKKVSPKIICVGVHTLYLGAHVPGAVFHGPGSSREGIADLKSYIGGIPRDSNIVLYCGCCPLDRCPNLRPAFRALQQMGFTHLRVLILPTSFAADWVEKGYPVEKGS